MLGITYVWCILSLVAWHWFPNDGRFVPAVGGGYGNLFFFVVWVFVGFPAFPLFIVVIATICASRRWSVRKTLLLVVVAALLGTIAAMIFPIHVQ
jgi:hypothetical protein